MKQFIRFSAIIMIVLAAGCKNTSKPVITEVSVPSDEQIVIRGEYLVTIMGCHDCHSPKQIGPQGPVIIPELMLSGYPADRPLKKVNREAIKSGWALVNEDLTSFAGFWGISFAANLTSDQAGIGNWPEANFIRALKEGKYKGLEGTRMLLPPMPWTNFINIADEDINAIYKYLKSIKAVRNVVPLAIAPGDIR